MTRAEANLVAQAGAADAVVVLGRAWEPPRSPKVVDAIIAARCGNPRAGLGAPSAGLQGSATSPALFNERNVGPIPTVSGTVRTGILVYEDATRAKTAFERLGVQAFEDCMVAAVNTYIHSDTPDREPVADATVASFDTTRAPAVAGDQATLITSTFEEEVIGGFDNFHRTALFVARSGPVIVTALAASNGQVLDRKMAAALARRLGVSALARVRKASRS